MDWTPIHHEDHDPAPAPATGPAPEPKQSREPKSASALPLMLSVGATPDLAEAMERLEGKIDRLISLLNAEPKASREETPTTP